MNSLVKDKYLIWTAIGVVVCVVSLGIAIGIGNDFNDDNFVRLIVFLCCNVFGWLIYLFFQFLILHISTRLYEINNYNYLLL